MFDKVGQEIEVGGFLISDGDAVGAVRIELVTKVLKNGDVITLEYFSDNSSKENIYDFLGWSMLNKVFITGHLVDFETLAFKVFVKKWKKLNN